MSLDADPVFLLAFAASWMHAFIIIGAFAVPRGGVAGREYAR